MLDLQATARLFQADLRLNGRSLRSIARRSDIKVTVEDGRWTLRDPKLKKDIRIQGGGRLPLNTAVHAAGADLQLSAAVQFPFDEPDMDFRLSLSGTRLDQLDELLRLRLPPGDPTRREAASKCSRKDITCPVSSFASAPADSGVEPSFPPTTPPGRGSTWHSPAKRFSSTILSSETGR